MGTVPTSRWASAGGGGAGLSGAAPGRRGGDGRVAAVHQRTDGHPLFMVHGGGAYTQRTAERRDSDRGCRSVRQRRCRRACSS